MVQSPKILINFKHSVDPMDSIVKVLVHFGSWEDRYHATTVESGNHLLQCLVYIDLHPLK